MRVSIASSGRFHLLDLARELHGLGAEVHFYSYVPRKRAEKFGLPSRCHVALLPFLFPLVAWERLFPRLFPRAIEWLMCWALDILTIFRMRPCDVFICMSGMYLQAPRFARWRYGARIILHRGSRHIRVSKRDFVPSSWSSTGHVLRDAAGIEGLCYIRSDRRAVHPGSGKLPSLARTCLQVVSEPLWCRPRSVSLAHRHFAVRAHFAVRRTLVISEGCGCPRCKQSRQWRGFD